MTLAKEMQQSIAALQRNDFATADRHARAALQLAPDDLSALQIMGAVCGQSGRVEEAIGYFDRAAKLAPENPDVAFNLAKAKFDAGEVAAAIELCSRFPQDKKMAQLRGAILRATGDNEQAIAEYRRAVELTPRDAIAWNNLGSALLESGGVEEASSAFEKAQRIDPQNAVFHHNRARAQRALGALEACLDSLSVAARLSPGNVQVLLDQARTLDLMGRSKDALPFVADAARIDRNNPEAFATMAVIFGNLNDLARSEQAHRFALQADPSHAASLLGLGIILEQANRLEELRELVSDARRRTASVDILNFLSALLLRRDGDLEAALAMAQSCKVGEIDANTKAHLVGQIADRLGQSDVAFEAFAEMNRASGSTPSVAKIDPRASANAVRQLTNMLSPEWVAGWQPVELDRNPAAPAFLLGFLRSGTTLLDTILMGHPGCNVMEEEPYLTQTAQQIGDLSLLGQLDTAGANELRRIYFGLVEGGQGSSGDRLIIDKNPLATLRAPLTARIFPDSKYIFALRHPCDVVLSCFMQNFKINQDMASFLTLETAANYYDAAMTFWEKARALLPLNVHTIRYEDMVEDLEGQMRPLLEFLDLDWSDEILQHQKTATARGYIRTPSYHQVTEGIYTRAKGRWTSYRSHFDNALPVLAPWIEKYGYSID